MTLKDTIQNFLKYMNSIYFKYIFFLNFIYFKINWNGYIPKINDLNI